MGRVVTLGHVLNSVPSMAESCFVSSLARSILGRGRFVVLAFISFTAPSKSTSELRCVRESGGPSKIRINQAAALQITFALAAGHLVATII